MRDLEVNVKWRRDDVNANANKISLSKSQILINFNDVSPDFYEELTKPGMKHYRYSRWDYLNYNIQTATGGKAERISLK